MTDNFYDETNSDNTKVYNEQDNSFSKPEEAVEESSYEWNSERRYSDGEYHYSYINGNNSNATHTPNNYEDAYSAQSSYQNSYAGYGNDYSAPDSNPYQTYTNGTTQSFDTSSQNNTKKAKKPKTAKSASRGFVAGALAVTMLCSGAVGFGGGYLLNKGNASDTTSENGLTIKQVSNDNSGTANAGSKTTVASGTSEIVKKTANSVVEIATEGVATGTFSQKYTTQGAGSGVIISEDGYIVTNHHVIEDTNKITVTLRDGTTSYDATLVGSDADNDIALLKIDAAGLEAATFGNSSNLVVGDYVVAIGNPLGTLGGTVTDGIISALAREVTIEDKNLTLLQTNAQISPGNSGGGLFNANGELIGIVNAKDSATEVEGIAFAIPINTVVGIIKDLKDYGYVTGKIDTGMEFVDVNSWDTAFYYGVSKLGCYVLSVELNSSAEQAGIRSGDIVTAVNGKEVSTAAEIDKALENNKVGDKVTFTVSRRGKSTDYSITLSEYNPSVQLDDKDSQKDLQSNDSFWDQLLNW